MSHAMARVESRGWAYACTPENQSTTSLACISGSPSPTHDEVFNQNGISRRPSEAKGEIAAAGLLYGKVPKNYTVAAWVSCFFGFTPIGIVAVIFSYKARKALNDLNMQAAYHFTKRAKYYTKMSVYVGVLMAVVIILALRTAWSLGGL